MAKIELNDRVKHIDGDIGTVVLENKGAGADFHVLWDDGTNGRLFRDDANIKEVIGKRYFVDTPFEIGQTYETGFGRQTVVGVGLICKNEYGVHSYREADGTCKRYAMLDLVLPKLEPKLEPKPEAKVCLNIDGVKYRLVPVEE